MAACRPRCPTVTRPRPTARCPAPRSTGLGDAAVRVLRARAVLHGALRLLRLQHLHRRAELGDVPGRLAGDVRRRRDRRGPAGPPGARRRRPAGATRSSSAAARRRCCRPRTWRRIVAAIDDEFGLAPGAEVTTESNPDSVDRRRPGRGCATAASPGCRSACSPRCPRAARCWTAPTTRCGCRGVVGWAREAGFEQVSLDLIYGTPGESLGRLADLARGGAGLRARPRLGVRADRRGGHRAGPAGPPRRAADARRRRPGRQVPARRRGASTAAGLGWYEVSNWARDAAGRLPAQPAATGPAATGGASGPARTRHVGGVRWWNVKHPTPYAERIAGGRQPRARPRGARRRDPTRRAGAARDPAARRAAASTSSTTPAGPRCPTWSSAGSSGAASRRPGRADHAGAGCSPTRWCATCSADAAGRSAGSGSPRSSRP